ncbi:hypothetical protein HPULCUR_011706 [Helicostylum pulchrum]|uniref:Uncharacterized protein n=1 Tax=Helicostylum pulchrum TaxID=562976 RepID=A0ABP9YGV3_9FUNG
MDRIRESVGRGISRQKKINQESCSCEISQYITGCVKPTLIGFLRSYKDSLACWHEEKIDDVEFRKLWTERFNSMYETIKAAVIKRKTKRHLEIETLRTQRFITTASNKRLRAEIENEATSSQSSSQQSQSSYEPYTDTSEDEIDGLEPIWNIGDFDIKLISDFNLNEYFYQISNKEHELINYVYYKLATNENGHAEEIVLEHMGNDNLRVCCKVLYNL